MGDREYGLDPDASTRSRRRSSRCMRRGSRSRSSSAAGTSTAGWPPRPKGMDRATADYAGMLATVLNALALQDALERRGAHTRVLSALDGLGGRGAVHPPPRDPPPREGTHRHLRRRHRQPVLHDRHGRRAALARDRRGGDPDGQARRGGRLRRRPRLDPDAEFLPALTHLEAIERGLKVMDTTALSLCMDNDLPIYVFEQADGQHPPRRRRRARRHDHLDQERRADGGHRRVISDATTPHGQVGRGGAQRAQHGAHRPRVRRAARPHQRRLLRQPTPLNQLATINVPEPRMLTIQPFDPNSVKAIEKAILESDLGLTPSNDGKIIRLPIPQLTEERRKELVKVVRHMAEEGRVAVRNVRRDAMQHLKELVEQRRGRRRRGAPRRGAGAEADRRAHEDDRRAAEAQRSRDHGGLSPFRRASAL